MVMAWAITGRQETREQKEARYYRLVQETYELGAELGTLAHPRDQRRLDAELAEKAGCPEAARIIREQLGAEHPRQLR
jgi:hypothetical protein